MSMHAEVREVEVEVIGVEYETDVLPEEVPYVEVTADEATWPREPARGPCEPSNRPPGPSILRRQSRYGDSSHEAIAPVASPAPRTSPTKQPETKKAKTKTSETKRPKAQTLKEAPKGKAQSKAAVREDASEAEYGCSRCRWIAHGCDRCRHRARPAKGRD